VRLLIERVLLEVVGATEKVRVECHWHGGVHTTHELTRPVARIASLSAYAVLTERARELRPEGSNARGSPRFLMPKDGASQAAQHLQRANGSSSPVQIGPTQRPLLETANVRLYHSEASNPLAMLQPIQNPVGEARKWSVWVQIDRRN
jgi:hypothetical protein